MAKAIGSTGTPVWIDKNGVPKPGDQKLITGEKFFTTSWKYAEYDASASGHIKAGTCWKDLPSTDIRKKCFSIDSAVSVSGFNYKGDKITVSVKPLIYTVQNDSLVHITLKEFTGTGGGDMIDMYMCVFNHDGSDAKWIRVSRFTEKFGNADEVMCCQFMCKAGTKFRFVFHNGTIKHITNGSNTVGRYCYQPMSADAEAYAYLWNSSTRTAKKGFTGGIDVTEFVLTGTNVTTGEVEEPSSDPESGGEVPGGGDAPEPIVIPTTDIGHDNTDDIQTVLVKNSTVVAPTHNSGSDTKPVCVKNGAIVPCNLPKSVVFLGTDANGNISKSTVEVKNYGDADKIADIVINGTSFPIHMKAQPTPKQHLVKFYMFGSPDDPPDESQLITQMYVDEGRLPTPPATVLDGWSFVGWDKQITPVSDKDVTYYGRWRCRTSFATTLSSGEGASSTVYSEALSIPAKSRIYLTSLTGTIQHTASPEHAIRCDFYAYNFATKITSLAFVDPTASGKITTAIWSYTNAASNRGTVQDLNALHRLTGMSNDDFYLVQYQNDDIHKSYTFTSTNTANNYLEFDDGVSFGKIVSVIGTKDGVEKTFVEGTDFDIKVSSEKQYFSWKSGKSPDKDTIVNYSYKAMNGEICQYDASTNEWVGLGVVYPILISVADFTKPTKDCTKFKMYAVKTTTCTVSWVLSFNCSFELK